MRLFLLRDFFINIKYAKLVEFRLVKTKFWKSDGQLIKKSSKTKKNTHTGTKDNYIGATEISK